MKGRPHRSSPALAAAICLAASLPLLVGWAESWTDIRHVMAGVKTIRSDFTQTKNLKILAKPLVSTGKFFYRAPDDLRWEYSAPLKNVLLITKDSVRRYAWVRGKPVEDASARLEAVRIVMEQIAGWLQGDFEENETFSARLVPGTPATIELVPKKKELMEFITQVTLTLSSVPGVISRILIAEPRGSSTVLDFSGVALNAPIDSAEFDRVK